MTPPPRPPVSLWPDPSALGTLADLYELTMMAGYSVAAMDQTPAVFELFVRRLPPGRSYLVFAGLEQALGDLTRLRISSEQAAYLKDLPAFAHVPPSWFEMLPSLRFEGDVWSVPEGTVVFAGETLVRVEAPLAQAQWVETLLLASLGYPTLVASKAARIVEAAGGRALYDYGARRGHGPQSGLLAARSAYLAGFSGTSHVEAAFRLGIPASGTMAHSWVQSFPDEMTAFSTFAKIFPDATTLLVDTYDVLEGVRKAASIEPPVRAIRLDSGDLASLAVEARRILDSRGRAGVRILVSGDLDEHSIGQLVRSGAPIDGFGVGTELITSRDAPALSAVYKLVQIDGRGAIKLSPNKKTYPLAKQVWRRRDESDRFTGDHVTRADETAEGDPLLRLVMQGGRISEPMPGLHEIREYRQAQYDALPESLKGLGTAEAYPISYSDLLEDEARKLGVKVD
ncbi:MAG TPA: nicotinate phosphoribosyltransferase [Isosphaeraceae bacterium]|nr:nicotinate phosphoribosyltransferase [Isosphaeraceae bacterium]